MARVEGHPAVGRTTVLAETATEPTLESRFCDGDKEAFAEIYRLYAGRVFAAAYRVLGDQHLAAEAVQLAFVKAWQAARSFDPDRHLLPWLCAIARRAAIDVYRQERRGPERETWGHPDSVQAVTPSLLEDAWLRWQVQSALARLDSDERAVLEMAYYFGMSQSDISRTAGIALGTVKSRTARAQRRLALLLAHLAFEADEAQADRAAVSQTTGCYKGRARR